MEKIKGVPVTDEMIQERADEAEKGYDVEQLRKRGRKPMGDGPLGWCPELLGRDPAGRSLTVTRSR